MMKIYIPKNENEWRKRYKDYVAVKKLLNKSFLSFEEYKNATLRLKELQDEEPEKYEIELGKLKR